MESSTDDIRMHTEDVQLCQESRIGEHNVFECRKLLNLPWRAAYTSEMAVLAIGGLFRLCCRGELLFYNPT